MDKRFLLSGCIVCSSAFVCGCDWNNVEIEKPSGPSTEWSSFGGTPGGGHYSIADEITRSNIRHLTQIWTHNSGDFHGPDEQQTSQQGTRGAGTSFQATPILVDGLLYYPSPYNRVFALDPETGEEKWVFDPQVEVNQSLYTPPSRGVSSWKSKDSDYVCGHRIIFGTMDGRLIALNASNGLPCMDFGKRGTVDLTEGLTPLSRTRDYAVTSPPAIAGDLVIVGAWVIDGNHSDAPSGVVRAYDVKSGEFRWGWNAVAPNTSPHDANGVFRGGTANVWSIISVDLDRELVIVPTGNPYPDYYGGDRQGFDYYSSSVVALDVNDGHVVWSFQTVHHDVWDYDVPAQPTFVDLPIDGETIPAVVQVTKMGMTFVLNRETGVPLFEVVEKPVPQIGAVAGEVLSATQPFPTKPKPLVQLGITPDDAWGLTFWDKGACRKEMEERLTGSIYTPTSELGTVMYPSQIGGHNWGSPAIDPVRKIMVVNTNHLAVVGQLIPRSECEVDQVIYPQGGTPYCYAAQPLVSPLGIPCTSPPWGTLSTIDLITGDVLWTVPMGTLGSWPLSMIKGGVTLGGPLTTKAGLIFIGASMDPVFRALDLETGEELWQADLPTTANSVPMTYRLENGRQFVVVAAGGHYAGFSEHGDHLVAFALPN
jgi:quinoprotein glucose dehydrogenase